MVNECEKKSTTIGKDWPPCFVYTGGQDKVVCNEMAERLYSSIYGEKKEHFKDEEIDHHPF